VSTKEGVYDGENTSSVPAGASPADGRAGAVRTNAGRLGAGYELLEQIKTIWQSNREAYGRPRIHTEPLPAGERVSPNRVGRLMRRTAPQAKIEEPRSRVQAPNQAAKRSRAPTHEPCTGQEIVQAKARASARHTVTVIG
jgi:hypothetical protein